jgi:hypothetical protein
VSGVTITLSGDASDSTTTAGDGTYSLTGLADGSYTVTPSLAGRVFTPTSTAVTISGANATGKDFAGLQAFPVVENYEADTAADNAATLEAKSTHYDVYGAGVTCQLDDYSTLVADARGTPFTKCITDIGTNFCGNSMLLEAGSGFVPTDDEVFLAEGVFFVSGTSAQASLYATSADGNEGILAGYIGGAFFLDTITSGAGTRKIDVATGLASNPDGVCWFYFGVQYNHANEQTYFRIIEFGPAGATQEDTNWVDGGICPTPTFNTATEWRLFKAASNSNTSAVQGVAQLRVCEQTVDGYGLGVVATHNYTDPS